MPRAATAEAPLTPEALMRKINQKWPGAMKKASDPHFEIKRLPTGILTLDVLMSGGFARDRHTELFGSYNVGKTYVTFRLIAQTQADGGRCAFVDAEGTFDPNFAEMAGVDLEALDLHEQIDAETVVDFVETLLRSGLYDVIIVDSIASLLPKSEKEAMMSQASMGTAQAKLMSQALRKLTAANHKTALVFINQTREAVGVMFGRRSITSGGKAMGFYAGTRLELTRTENIKKKTKVVDSNKGEHKATEVVKGHRVLVRVEKDKTGATHQAAETTFVYDYELGGIDPVEDWIYLGLKYGLVHKSGTRWWVHGYDDEKQASRGKFKNWLRRNLAVGEELEELIWDAYDNDSAGEDDDADDPDGTDDSE